MVRTRFGHRRTLLVCSTVTGLGAAADPSLPIEVLVRRLPVLAYLGATAGCRSARHGACAVRPRGPAYVGSDRPRASNAGFVIGPRSERSIVIHSYDALFVIDGLIALAVRS